MKLQTPHIYIHGTTFLYKLSSLSKLIALLIYSITIFAVDSWTGLIISFLFLFAGMISVRASLRRFIKPIIPLLFILIFTLIFNSFSWDITTVSATSNLSLNILSSFPPIALVGNFGFYPIGFERGLFYSIRIILLFWASMLLVFTTTDAEIINGLLKMLSPLKKIKIPVEDIAMIISIALRFIPVTAEEFSIIYAAQWARGAKFEEGGIWERLRVWFSVLIPVFISMFRRSDVLATALDARCYGMLETRGSLHVPKTEAASVLFVLVVLLASGALIAVF